MAAELHYSKGHLSKLETGSKKPTPELARRCDALLEANGALASLVPARTSEAPLPESNGNGEVWLMSLEPGGRSRFRPVDRRQVLAAGAASMLSFGMGGGRAIADGAPVIAFRTMFDQFRQLGQSASPSVVLPALIAQTHTIRELAATTSSRARGELLVLGARYAEFAGWMAQESGEDEAALWWTDHAVELAEAGGDRSLAAYSLVRRALVTLYREDAQQTIALARRAQRTAGASARVLGLAAQREAQGHALAGDYDSCMRSLDRARRFLSDPASESGPVLGPANLSDPVAMVSGWCLHDLGRTKEAAAALDRELQRVPPTALRSAARYGVRRALAHAGAGDVDQACALLGSVLGTVDAVSSATITTDLRRLARALSRFHTAPAVRELQPRLIATLHQQNI
ncbi:transcriptional regulator [Saccharopolyspora indica]|uniref:transcriptional regulator n=1 Tax=Saccharopolyspora indica TaxID=1229659 RepID=UPI0022EB9D36|nr:transcriptional regulator [Saccharopolyspora indica]MDA3647044.1 transcriptional regulator [Saccharopolyspora indica]